MEGKVTSSSQRTAEVGAGQVHLSLPGRPSVSPCLGEHPEKGEVSLEVRTGEEPVRARDGSSEGTPEALPPSPWITDAYLGSRHSRFRGQFQKGGSFRAMNQKEREETVQEREGREERREMGGGKGRAHHQAWQSPCETSGKTEEG